MNKISDLKVGDQVVTNNYGKAIVAEINEHGLKLKDSEIKVNGCPYFVEWEIDWQKTNELNNKQMELNIEVPQGFEIDKDKSTFEKIVFKEIGNKLPMSVEEIPNRDFYINSHGTINQLAAENGNNGLSTKERAEAFLALMQLVELRDAWNGDWKADWSYGNLHKKYVIEVLNNYINSKYYQNYYKVLHFKSEQLRDQFAEQFKDLIEQAKELL